ncbi:MAG TPA: hypothetical protein VLW53_12415 [Candidatus Eisenbacteria bacterium]|nr:hypothetical protein [Candidatus Eisenbacteria bacterium]
MRGLALLLVLACCACGSVSRPGAQPPSPTPASRLSESDLRYRLIDGLGSPVFCDPLVYPVARTEDPADVARMVAALRAQSPDEFDAIVRHEHLDATSLSPADNLRVLGQASELAAIALTPQGSRYAFHYQLLGPPTADVTGTIDQGGSISVASRTPAPRRPCPVCLAQWTRVATPHGELPVTELRPGTIVWTQDADGSRVPAPVLAVRRTPAPAGHLVVHLVLADGRRVDVSPGHPLGDGRAAGDLRPGDRVDGSVVAAAGLRPYGGAATWDLLPAGRSGRYWADGVPLGSTLAGSA